MGRLVYTTIASLDGFVSDERGRFDWAAPGEDVHRFVNDLERDVGTHLYGRRMYEVMSVWQDVPGPGREHGAVQDYAQIWRSADTVVYSTTLAAVATPRTRMERAFDPDSVRTLVSRLDRDVSIGGATLAGQALRAGIVDDIHVLTIPVLVGGGTRCWPAGASLSLDLRAQDRFADGTVHHHYRVRRRS